MSFQMHPLIVPRTPPERNHLTIEMYEIMRAHDEAEYLARIERRERKRLQRDIARFERRSRRNRLTRFLHPVAKRV